MTIITDLSADALAIFKAGVAAADPHDAVAAELEKHQPEITAARRIIVIAAGKGAVPMIRAAIEKLPKNKTATAFAVTNYENAQEVADARIVGASHPLPDENGASAARELESIVHDAREGDLVLCLISGGASALLPAPVEGVSLSEKIATNDLLLKSGADITTMNTVRKALSRLKGGGLAKAIAPAKGIALILSDVPGDDLAIIASGPTVPDPAPAGKALEIVRSLGLEDQLPESVLTRLSTRSKHPETPASPLVQNVLIGSNRISLHAAERDARRRGYHTLILSDWLEGDVRDAARAFLNAASDAPKTSKLAILAGGETSVQVTGSGKGGRNQEMALRFALMCENASPREAWVFLSGGTDGRDGPTDAAGGLTRPDTIAAIRKAGITVEESLANNDAYHALQSVDALLMTGATGTNVADLQVLLLG